jgi:hypothetical protein
MKRTKAENIRLAKAYVAGHRSASRHSSGGRLDGISAEEDAEAAKLMREQNQHRPKGEPPWLAIVRGNAGGK